MNEFSNAISPGSGGATGANASSNTNAMGSTKNPLSGSSTLAYDRVGQKQRGSYNSVTNTFSNSYDLGKIKNSEKEYESLNLKQSHLQATSQIRSHNKSAGVIDIDKNMKSISSIELRNRHEVW